VKLTTATEALVPVYRTNDELTARLYSAMLEGAGIQVLPVPVFERYIYISDASPVYRLLVPEPDARRAEEMIEDYRQLAEAGALELREDEVPDAPPPMETVSLYGIRVMKVTAVIGALMLGLAFYTRGWDGSLLYIALLFLGLVLAERLMFTR